MIDVGNVFEMENMNYGKWFEIRELSVLNKKGIICIGNKEMKLWNEKYKRVVLKLEELMKLRNVLKCKKWNERWK